MTTIPQNITDNLKTVITERLKIVPNFQENVSQVAEYVTLLMSNGSSPADILQEMTSLFDSVSAQELQNVVTVAFNAAENLKGGDDLKTVYAKLNQQASAEPAAPVVSGFEKSEPNAASNTPISAFAGVLDTSTERTGKAHNQIQRPLARDRVSIGGSSRIGASSTFKGGISKHGGPSRRGVNSRIGANQLAMALGFNESENTSHPSHSIVIKREGRCPDFPHCPLGRKCSRGHPTATCPQYPNCKNAPGTCTYLHPNEDEALIQELEKVREERRIKREEFQKKQQQRVSGIVLCKFGIICSSQLCPYGHPTPANEDAKVVEFSWCENNLQCTDPTCKKAHSSLSKIRDVKGVHKPTPQVKPNLINTKSLKPKQIAGSMVPPEEKILEQCKFGTKCTNKRCPKRHAKSTIMCREGDHCIRIDCFFGHPVHEPCRHGAECRTYACLFEHPANRVLPEKPKKHDSIVEPSESWPNAGISGGNSSSNERPFALPESTVESVLQNHEYDGDAMMTN